jgi:hypothetical protein
MHQRRLPLAYSCPQSLDGMPRISEAERWCSICRKRVHELSNLRESEARRLLRAGKKRGRMCVNYRVDDRGRVQFRDRPAPGRGRRALALSGLALAVTVAASGCVGFESEEITQPEEYAPAYWADSSFEPLRVEVPPPPPPPTPTNADAEPGQLLILVVDASRDELPIVGIAVEVEWDSGSLDGWTGMAGSLRFDDLEAGAYMVEVQAEGYAGTKTWVQIDAGESSTLTFRIEPEQTVEPSRRRSEEIMGDIAAVGAGKRLEEERRERLRRLEAEAAAAAEG